MFRQTTASKLWSGNGSSSSNVADMDAADHFRLAMHRGVARNVHAERLQPGQRQHEILHQKALGAADVEHAVAGFRFQCAIMSCAIGSQRPS